MRLKSHALLGLFIASLASVALGAALAGCDGSRPNFTIPVCDYDGESCYCYQAGFTKCEWECVDTRYDTANCGNCGYACASGQRCLMGLCKADCEGGTWCGERCTDHLSDPYNCGGCGVRCEGGCEGGVCGSTPRQCYDEDSNTTSCNGQCVNLREDAKNCGRCGTVCQCSCQYGKCTSEELCGGRCVDTSDDKYNCGGCGNACGSGSYCSSGRCK